MREELRSRFVETAEKLDWGVHIYEEKDGSRFWEFSKYSPEGEDFIFTVEEGEDGVDLEVKRYAMDFDADEHAEMWVNSRGKNGVPNSIRALIDDADAIQKMLDELADALAETDSVFWGELVDAEFGECEESEDK